MHGFWVTVRLLLQKRNCQFCKCLSRVLPQRLGQSWVEISDSEESLINEQSAGRGSCQKQAVDLDQKDEVDSDIV